MNEKYEILVVDDDKDVLDSIGKALKREKIFVPTLVERGDKALEMVLDSEYDAYLVDQNMPDMQGTEFST